jgi:trigger factor
MQTTLEETDRHVVKLSVEVPPEEFARDLDRAYRKVAGEIRIPGFRKGKVPKQVIDARVGRDVVVEEFVHDSIPAYYLRAVREHELAPIADPEIDVEDVDTSKPLRFTATVTVRPRLTLDPSDYTGVRVDAPSEQPTDHDVEEYVDALRERFAELETVSRPARKGDYVLADVRASVHDREIPEASRVGFLSEIGSEELVPQLDAELEGKRAGDIVKFNATLPERFGEDLSGQEVTFTALVKDVKAKKLPAADDDFARTASEFDTIDELRENVREQVGTLKAAEARAILRDRVLSRLIEKADVDLPEQLVDEETEERVQRAERRAQQAGLTLDQVLEQQGWDQLRFRSDARAHAVRAIKGDLVLEAIARNEDLQPTAEDLDREIESLAEATGRDAREVRRIVERTGQVATLAGDIIRGKALDLAVERADVATEDAPTAPEPEATEEPGGET